jgi:hypothetical protein
MIKTLCVVVLSLALASCGAEADAAAGGCGDCAECGGCELQDGQEGAADVGEAAKDAVDKKDAMTPAPADLPKQPDEGK